MTAEMSHYRVLQVRMDATDAAIRDAYKRLILAAHPDKGGSVARFRQLQAAYEVLRETSSRRLYDEKLRAERRKKAFIAPPPHEGPLKAPVTFTLPNGEPYVFETAPDRLRSRFRHGDLIEDPDNGQRGVFVGLATNGLFWCHVGTEVAVPMSTFGGDKDLIVVFRSPVVTSPTLNTPRGGAPRASAFPSDDAETGAASGAARSRARTPPAGSRFTESSTPHEVHMRQRSRVLSAAMKILEEDESNKRDLLKAGVFKAFEDLHAAVAARMRVLRASAVASTAFSSAAGARSASAGVTRLAPRTTVNVAVPPGTKAGTSGSSKKGDIAAPAPGSTIPGDGVSHHQRPAVSSSSSSMPSPASAAAPPQSSSSATPVSSSTTPAGPSSASSATSSRSSGGYLRSVTPRIVRRPSSAVLPTSSAAAASSAAPAAMPASSAAAAPTASSAGSAPSSVPTAAASSTRASTPVASRSTFGSMRYFSASVIGSTAALSSTGAPGSSGVQHASRTSPVPSPVVASRAAAWGGETPNIVRRPVESAATPVAVGDMPRLDLSSQRRYRAR